MFAACTKKQPQFELLRPSAGDRVILVEEFSGALCPNCPQGTLELENLKDIYGDQLVVLTIHAGDFAFPYPDSKFDFTTEGGDVLLDILGNPIGYPSGVINRKREGPQGGFQEFSSRWAASISASLEDSTLVDISQVVTYDQASRTVDVVVDVLAFENFSAPVHVNVVLKENDIIDPQADRAASTGKVSDYVHKNVLRKVLSNPQGDPTQGPLNALESETFTYQFTLPSEDGWWKAEDCWIVSFVTSATNSSGVGEVLQATQTKMVATD